jgi:diguanylate cyclase (GGDEF)-like protein
MNDRAPQICIDERLARLQRRVERERKARSEAESLLEAKSRELYQANQKLLELAAGLEERVAERTRELLMEHERAVGLARDVVKSEKEIADQVQRLQAALANMPAGLSMFDSELRLIVCNDRYAELYGLPADLVAPGTPLALLIGHNDRSGRATPHDHEAQDRLVSEHLAKLAKREPFTYIQRLSDGRSVRVTVGPMTNGGWVDVHEDITDRLLLEERVAHLALHDPLTGLPNRLLLRERLEQDLASTGSSGEVAVLCLDLDNFKEANDAFGHAFGDELLCAISRRLETAAQGAFTARVGGDEFTVVLPICARSPAAAALADRLLKSVSEEFEIRGQRVQVGLSVGGAIYPRDGTDITTLLGNADAALYLPRSMGATQYDSLTATWTRN